MENLKISRYETESENIRSRKAEKLDRKALREINNSYAGKRRIIKESREKKLLSLMEEENQKKTEDKKYKKLTKKQLLESLRPKSILLELPKQEAKLLYFNRARTEAIYNLAGKEAERKHNIFLKENRRIGEINRAESLKIEVKEKAEKTRKEAVNKKLEAIIENLIDGSYKLVNGKWERKEPKKGYFVEIKKYEGKIKNNEYLGIWHDNEDNGRLYIGISKLVKERETAETLARNAKHNYITGEKAIWDNANSCEIRI